VPAEARIEIVRTAGSSGRESAHFENQSRLTSAATVIVPPEEVREKFHRVKPLKDISIKQRGWTLDVLNIVERVVAARGSGLECGGTTPLSLGEIHRVLRGKSLPVPKRGHVRALQNEFTNEDIYAHARELEALHPDNRHIKDKIRQQLQVLRDTGFLVHVGSGRWRKAAP
jgi:hypothetical protein